VTKFRRARTEEEQRETRRRAILEAASGKRSSVLKSMYLSAEPLDVGVGRLLL
jgi:hypothetical protein